MKYNKASFDDDVREIKSPSLMLVVMVMVMTIAIVMVMVMVVVHVSDCKRILSGRAFINSSLLHYTAKGRLLHEDNIEH